jgi:hypothetical protein
VQFEKNRRIQLAAAGATSGGEVQITGEELDSDVRTTRSLPRAVVLHSLCFIRSLALQVDKLDQKDAEPTLIFDSQSFVNSKTDFRRFHPFLAALVKTSYFPIFLYERTVPT